jgi:ferredoxin hydrogenase gamma subunit
MCRQIEEGSSPYHFIEVMACPGGCVDGGGNPRKKNCYLETQAARTEGIYKLDRERPIRQSHNNPDVVRLYKEFLGKPCGHLSHELLHTHYKDRTSKGKVMSITDIWKEVKLG